MVDTFEHAKTFGSLIQIPAELNVQLAAMKQRFAAGLRDGDLYAQAAAQDLLPLVAQALVLGMQFDAVVANPPYMGGKRMNASLEGLRQGSIPMGREDQIFSPCSSSADFWLVQTDWLQQHGNHAELDVSFFV